MLGVVLAGGLATRLPNKPLLPLKNHKPAITSALDFLMRSGIERPYVVIPPGSAIPDVLMAFNYFPKYVIQPEANGVCGAIMALNDSRCTLRAELGNDQLIVTYCDNVYGDTTRMPHVNEKVRLGHSIVRIESSIKSRALSRYSDGVWAPYTESMSPWCVAGWLLINGEILNELGPADTSTEQLLNVHNGIPIRYDDPNWYDIGTPLTYQAYWRAP